MTSNAAAGNHMAHGREKQLRRELIGDAIAYYQVNLTSGIVEEYRRVYADAIEDTDDKRVSAELLREFMELEEPDDAKRLRDTFMPDALNAAHARGESTVNQVYRKRLPDLGLRWVKATASLITRPQSGDVVAFLYVRDIDAEMKDHLAIEKILDEDVDYVVLIHALNGVAHYIKHSGSAGGDGLSFDFDKEFESLLRAQAHKDDLHECLAYHRVDALRHALKRAPVTRLNYRAQDADGMARKQARAAYLDDTREDIILIRRDITDLYEEEQRTKRALERAADAANAANSAKSEFLSRMSHDMRTPLTAILALSDEYMNDGARLNDVLHNMRRIHASGEYLLGIINDVLDMSHIESKRITLKLAPYALSDFRATVDTVIGKQCRDKGISFIFKTEGVTYPYAMLDKVRFNQVFINLLSNAVKFTPPGGTVEFGMRTLEVNGDWVKKRFTVRDTGIGMSEEFLPKAFESFAQEKLKDADENNLGTGLGLAIVKQLVELMGGSITLNSRLGEGTLVTVDISYRRAPSAEMSKRAETSYQALSGLKVLVCEDHPLNTQIISGMLTRKGCIVDAAENGEAGVNMFARSPHFNYDIILMDIRMPIMNGLEATRAIRALERPDAQSVPILALTADAFNEDARTSLGVGMNGHLSKPIEPGTLYGAMLEQLK